LVRHSNKGDDGLLSQEGEERARAFGAGLKKNREEIHAIVTSPKARNLRTAELIAEAYGGLEIVRDDRLAYHFSEAELERYNQNPFPEIIRCLLSCPGAFLEDAIRTFEAVEEHGNKEGNVLGISHNSNVSSLAYVMRLAGSRTIPNLMGRETKPLEGVRITDNEYRFECFDGITYRREEVIGAFEYVRKKLPTIVKEIERVL
jgi:phosphohistidine phosphatase SixA